MSELKVVLIAMCVMFANVAFAERLTSAFETGQLNIKLSNDRTGIVQKVSCPKCDFNIVRITAETKAFANGQEVDLLRAKRRLGKMATVIFYRDTGEAQKITWLE